MTRLRTAVNLIGAGVIAFVLTTCVVAALAQGPQRYEVICRYAHVINFDTAEGTLLVALGPQAEPDSVGDFAVPRWPYGVFCAGESES